jgi:chromosome segregation ATPase
MTSPTTPDDSAADASIDPDLAALEQRLSSLLAYARALRAANEALRRGLTAAEERNQALSERIAEAKRRIDALVARLPEPAE